MATKKIAFYTLGDTRPVNGARVIYEGRKRRLQMSQMWHLRAKSLAMAGMVHGVKTTDAAESAVKKVEKGAAVKFVYLVGHGFGQDGGGFFFSGKPAPPPEEFTATATDTLSLLARIKMKKFAKALAGVLSKSEAVQIAFLSCYTGRGKFTREFYSEVRAHGIKKLTVGAYTDYYQTAYHTDGRGNISRWSDYVRDGRGTVIVKAGANGIPAFQERHPLVDPDDPLAGL